MTLLDIGGDPEPDLLPIERLRLGAGDTLLVKLPEGWTAEQMRLFNEWMQAVVDDKWPGVKVMCLSQSFDVSVQRMQ